jgi:hypothetical protein
LITLSSKTKDNKGSIREKIPFEHPKIEIAEAKDIAAPDVVKEGLKALKASGDFRYEVCRDGLLLGSPYGFAWIPSKDLIPVIEQTLKDLGHSVESPTSR